MGVCCDSTDRKAPLDKSLEDAIKDVIVIDFNPNPSVEYTDFFPKAIP